MISFFALTFHLFDRYRLGRILFYLLTSILLVTLTMRGTGTGLADYDAYKRIYSNITSWNSVVFPSEHVEIGYRLLSFLGNTLGFAPQYIIIVMGVLSLLPVIYLINKYSPYRSYSLLVWLPYILTMNLQASRISVAAAFGLCFLVFAYQAKKKLAIILFFAAISFHLSAGVLLLSVLAFLSVNALFGFLVFVSFISMFFDLPGMVGSLFTFLGQDLLAYKFSVYISSEDYGYPMVIYDPRVIFVLFVSIFIFLIRRRVFDRFHIFLFKIFIIGAILMMAFLDVTMLAWRLSYLFLIVGVLVVPLVSKYYIINMSPIDRSAYLVVPVFCFSLSVVLAVTSKPFIFFWSL